MSHKMYVVTIYIAPSLSQLIVSLSDPNSQRYNNRPPTNIEIKHAQEIINTHETTLSFLSERLIKERDRLALSERAIDRLSPAVTRAKKVFEYHKQNLALLEANRNRFSCSEWNPAPDNLPNEAGMSEFYGPLMSHIDYSYQRGHSIIDKEVEVVKKEVIKLSRLLSSLEEELAGWKFIRDLAFNTTQSLSEAINILGPGIDNARLTMSPRNRVPDEIWILIFNYCLLIEFEEYLMESDVTPFRPVPVILSLVSSSWRNLVSMESRLWSLVTVHPSLRLSKSEGELIDRWILNLGREATLVMNLSQWVRWEWEPSHKHPNDVVTRIKPPYSFHLITNGGNYTESAVVEGNFVGVETLQITVRPSRSISSRNLWKFLENFTHITRFEFSDKGTGFSKLNGLATRFPNLQFLRLQFDDMPSIDLTTWINPNLVELRIKHNGSQKIPSLQHSITLSNLKALGINYLQIGFLGDIKVPELQILELYSPEDSYYRGGNIPIECALILRRIHALSFHNWKIRPDITVILKKSKVVSGCAALAFRELGNSTPALEEIKFVDCAMNGRPLIDAFERFRQTRSFLSNLRAISLIGCSVITRSECDKIREIFPKTQICEPLSSSFTLIET
jgi:hypothetical protein